MDQAAEGLASSRKAASTPPEQRGSGKQPSSSPSTARSRVKREWHGVTLGSAPQDLGPLAKAMGYIHEHNGKPTCTVEEKGRITLYDYKEHAFTVQRDIPLTECWMYSPAGAEHDAKVKKHPQVGVRVVHLRYINNKLYEIELDFFDSEPFDGIAKNMTAALGPAHWNGPLNEKTCCREGAIKTSPHDGREWSDDDTVILAYVVNVNEGLLEPITSSNVHYLNFAMLPEIQPLQKAAVESTQPDAGTESSATF